MVSSGWRVVEFDSILSKLMKHAEIECENLLVHLSTIHRVIFSKCTRRCCFIYSVSIRKLFEQVYN